MKSLYIIVKGKIAFTAFSLYVVAIPLTCGCNKTIEREIVIREPLPIIEVSQDYNQLKRNVEHYNLFARIENNKLQDEYSKTQKK